MTIPEIDYRGASILQKERRGWGTLFAICCADGTIYYLVRVDRTPMSLHLLGRRLIWVHSSIGEAQRTLARVTGQHP